jgi:Hyaluronan / mRNA binding family
MLLMMVYKLNSSQNNTRRSAPEANAKRAPKSGGGSHNWGNDNEDARKVTKEGRIDGDDLDTPAADDGEAPAEAEVEVVPGNADRLNVYAFRLSVSKHLLSTISEPVTFSLDEYMAKRNAARANQEVFAAVKERAVDAKIDGSKVDSSLENYFVNGGLKENKSKAKDGKAKQVLAISFLAGSTEKPETERERGPRPERGSSGAGRGGRDSTRPAPRENRSGKSSGAYFYFVRETIFPF